MQPKLHSDAACAAYHEAGLWGDKLIVDYVDDHARRDPVKAAIVDCRETITYAALVRRSENLAAALKANLKRRKAQAPHSPPSRPVRDRPEGGQDR